MSDVIFCQELKKHTNEDGYFKTANNLRIRKYAAWKQLAPMPPSNGPFSAPRRSCESYRHPNYINNEVKTIPSRSSTSWGIPRGILSYLDVLKRPSCPHRNVHPTTAHWSFTRAGHICGAAESRSKLLSCPQVNDHTVTVFRSTMRGSVLLNPYN